VKARRVRDVTDPTRLASGDAKATPAEER
jgi:hypothetical protein